jgi:hypothetical protein
MTQALPEARRTTLLRRGFVLEYITLGWTVVGILVLAGAAWSHGDRYRCVGQERAVQVTADRFWQVCPRLSGHWPLPVS